MRKPLLVLFVAMAATMAFPDAPKSDAASALPIAWSGRLAPELGTAFSPVRPVQYRCRADCRYCRDVCYGRWRARCYGPRCRGRFTACMRGCWEQICRWC